MKTGVTTTPGFNWSLWAKVPGEGRADHEEGLVGGVGLQSPRRWGAFCLSILTQ